MTAKCDNCQKKWNQDELNTARDLHERIEGHKMTTTSFTPKQAEMVEPLVDEMVKHCMTRIQANAPGIKALDARPKEPWTKEKPDVFFHYVAQGMLEELISRLQEQV